MSNPVVDSFVVVILFIWGIIYSIVLKFVPKKFLHKNVKGQIVLVTGGGSGFGRILARKFAVDHGSTVVIWDVSEQGMAETAKEVKQGGGKIHSYKVDVSSRTEIYAAAKKVRSEVGKVDILINNAGIAFGEWLVNLEDDKIEKIYQVNTLAHYWTTKAFLPEMVKTGTGHIVTIASAAGLFGVPRITDYCGTKFAAVGFHESLTSELKVGYPDAKIETTLICPYFVRTPILKGKEDHVKSSVLLPVREPEPVVSEFMDAILTNETILIPSLGVRVLIFLKANLPANFVNKCLASVNKQFMNPKQLPNQDGSISKKNY